MDGDILVDHTGSSMGRCALRVYDLFDPKFMAFCGRTARIPSGGPGGSHTDMN